MPTGLLFVACSACFLMGPRTTSLGIASPTMGCSLPYQSIIKKMPYMHTYRLILDIFSVEISFHSEDSNLCNVDIKLARTLHKDPISKECQILPLSVEALRLLTTLLSVLPFLLSPLLFLSHYICIPTRPFVVRIPRTSGSKVRACVQLPCAVSTHPGSSGTLMPLHRDVMAAGFGISSTQHGLNHSTCKHLLST